MGRVAFRADRGILLPSFCGSGFAPAARDAQPLLVVLDARPIRLTVGEPLADHLPAVAADELHIEGAVLAAGVHVAAERRFALTAVR